MWVTTFSSPLTSPYWNEFRLRTIATNGLYWKITRNFDIRNIRKFTDFNGHSYIMLYNNLWISQLFQNLKNEGFRQSELIRMTNIRVKPIEARQLSRSITMGCLIFFFYRWYSGEQGTQNVPLTKKQSANCFSYVFCFAIFNTGIRISTVRIFHVWINRSLAFFLEYFK